MVGGGIIGNSVAYHLAKMGMTDVVLLEQQQVTAGTTWHAAGLMVTFGSINETSTDMRKYSKILYHDLIAETGQETGLRPVGRIFAENFCKILNFPFVCFYFLRALLSWHLMQIDWKSIEEFLQSTASMV